MSEIWFNRYIRYLNCIYKGLTHQNLALNEQLDPDTNLFIYNLHSFAPTPHRSFFFVYC